MDTRMDIFLKRNSFKLFIFFLAFVLVWLRRVDILTNAQFWAEDSVFWYKDAYENGFFNSLVTPRNGYFQTVSTLVVGGTTFFDPLYAPLISNIIGILIRSIIIWYLFTNRFSFLDITSKVFISIYLLCMPGLHEVHANITNAHWYLSLYVSMILISKQSTSKSWHIHDLFFIILAGLSGPFVIFLLISTIFKYINEFRERLNINTFFAFYLRPNNIAIILCSLIQAASILLTFSGTRSSAPLGFSIDVMTSILASNIFLFTFAPWNIAITGWESSLLAYTLSVFIISMTIFLYIKGDWRMKVFATLPLLIIVFSMAKPQLTDVGEQLPTLINGEGSRYFVNIHIAIFSLACVSCFKLIKNKSSALFTRVIISVLLLFMIYLNYFIQPLPDMNWSHGAELINKATPGEKISFHVLPPRLTLDLIKK